MFGWPCDPEMERLRNRFAREENDPKKHLPITKTVQVQATKIVSRIPTSPVGSTLAHGQEPHCRNHPSSGTYILEHGNEIRGGPARDSSWLNG